MFIDRGKSLVHKSGYSFLMQKTSGTLPFWEDSPILKSTFAVASPLRLFQVMNTCSVCATQAEATAARMLFAGSVQWLICLPSAVVQIPVCVCWGTQDSSLNPINKWPGNISQKPFKPHPVVSRRNSQHPQTLQNVVGPPWKCGKEHPANQWMEEHPQHLSTYDQRYTSHIPFIDLSRRNCRTCLRLVVPDLSVTSDLG